MAVDDAWHHKLAGCVDHFCICVGPQTTTNRSDLAVTDQDIGIGQSATSNGEHGGVTYQCFLICAASLGDRW